MPGPLPRSISGDGKRVLSAGSLIPNWLKRSAHAGHAGPRIGSRKGVSELFRHGTHPPPSETDSEPKPASPAEPRFSDLGKLLDEAERERAGRKREGDVDNRSIFEK